MIIETSDFEYKTLRTGYFLGVWPRYQVKRLREGERVSTVLTFSLFGLNFHVAKVSKRLARWRCRSCGHEVKAGRCACQSSPSPWELIG